jgi:NADH-quinone oxidoreductase subunit K
MLVNYLIVGAILFTLGVIGFLTRRNMIVMFLSAEMMLQGVSLNLISFGRAWGDPTGQVFTIFVLTVAAAEAALALTLVLGLYRRSGSLDVTLWQELREPGQPAIVDEPEDLAAPPAEPPPVWPQLPPAGLEPAPSRDPEEEAAHA